MRVSGVSSHHNTELPNSSVIMIPGHKVINIFFMLNSVEHEILNAHKDKNIKKFGFFLRLR